MHHVRSTAAVLAILAVAVGSQATGCFFSADTDELKGQPSGTGGAGGEEPPSCPGDPVADPSLVRDECGTFVSASAAPGGDGTKARPYQTFGEAAGVGAKRIYACSGDYNEADAVRFNDGVEIFGGFTDCGGGGEWTWAEGSRATLIGVANKVALALDGGDNRLRNVNVTAPNATDPGASSIAMVATGGTLDLMNGDLRAGDAMNGAAGESLAADPMLDGEDGDPGVGVCNSGANNPGPVGKTKTCPTGGTSVGGNGGDGGELMGSMLLPAGSGTAGTPPDPGQPMDGLGGIGEGQGMPPATSCEDGETGASGLSLTGASGAGASGPGSLSIDGYAGADGTAGMNGKPGQGGGGGGASRGGLSITCPGGGTANRVGASGGAGGTGGCGGASGGGGQAGGSSIALIVVDTVANLSGVTLTAGRAGNGGIGGDGQPGGQRGLGGALGAGAGAAQESCAGGDGGTGGTGGPGGGGQGGHSLGIAFQGSTAPAQDNVTTTTDNEGTGGLGGANSSAPMGGAGADGAAANCWDFAANAECPAN